MLKIGIVGNMEEWKNQKEYIRRTLADMIKFLEEDQVYTKQEDDNIFRFIRTEETGVENTSQIVCRGNSVKMINDYTGDTIGFVFKSHLHARLFSYCVAYEVTFLAHVKELEKYFDCTRSERESVSDGTNRW